jgi:hypothetical protein
MELENKREKEIRKIKRKKIDWAGLTHFGPHAHARPAHQPLRARSPSLTAARVPPSSRISRALGLTAPRTPLSGPSSTPGASERTRARTPSVLPVNQPRAWRATSWDLLHARLPDHKSRLSNPKRPMLLLPQPSFSPDT